jgi:hypothetical protein
MEEALETLIGQLLIILVSFALVSAVVIIVLIELGWIVRLVARLYWRWRSSMHPLGVGTEQVTRRNGTSPLGRDKSE